jgi:RNA polymerase sigma-70 factor (family 1)
MIDYHSLSDSKLMALLKSDDHVAFTQIFDRYNKLLYSHAYNKLRNEDESRDVVQDVFIRTWEKRSAIQDNNLAGLLFTMLRNKIINLISHQKVVSDYTSSLKDYELNRSISSDHLVREKLFAALIEEEIAALPPRMKEIFLLSRREHLSNKEIAAKLDLSEHTVADQIKKALRILRPKIGLILVLASILNR